jgi:hypothetical protein
MLEASQPAKGQHRQSILKKGRSLGWDGPTFDAVTELRCTLLRWVVAGYLGHAAQIPAEPSGSSGEPDRQGEDHQASDDRGAGAVNPRVVHELAEPRRRHGDVLGQVWQGGSLDMSVSG